MPWAPLACCWPLGHPWGGQKAGVWEPPGTSRWSEDSFQPTQQTRCPCHRITERCPSPWRWPLPLPLVLSLPFPSTISRGGDLLLWGRATAAAPACRQAALAAGTELQPLQEGMRCACFMSPCTRAGRIERLQGKDTVLVPLRSLMSFGGLKAA